MDFTRYPSALKGFCRQFFSIRYKEFTYGHRPSTERPATAPPSATIDVGGIVTRGLNATSLSPGSGGDDAHIHEINVILTAIIVNAHADLTWLQRVPDAPATRKTTLRLVAPARPFQKFLGCWRSPAGFDKIIEHDRLVRKYRRALGRLFPCGRTPAARRAEISDRVLVVPISCNNEEFLVSIASL